jgi:ribA/ribD-fused uncharacterized protein
MTSSPINLLDHGIAVRDGFAFFWGGPLSNWYPATFYVDDVLFYNSEQYMMHQKALVCGDFDSAKVILLHTKPDKVKALGRKIAPYDDKAWSAARFNAVYDGCLAKFHQNPALARVLLATEGLELVEASPYDKVWGIGMAANDTRATNKSQWQGENLLGLVLEKVRAELLKE